MIRSSHCRLGGGVGSLLGRKKNRRWRVCMKSFLLLSFLFWGLQIQGGRDIEQCDLSMDSPVCSFHCCDFFSLESGREGQLWQFAAVKITTLFGSSESFLAHFHKLDSILSQSQNLYSLAVQFVHCSLQNCRDVYRRTYIPVLSPKIPLESFISFICFYSRP